MAVYSIAYTLKGEGRDYSEVENLIDTLGDARKIDETYWIIETAYIASEIRNEMGEILGPKDTVFVVRVYPGASWRSADPQLKAWLESLSF